EAIGRAVVTGDPELAACGTVLQSGVIKRNGGAAIRDARDVDVPRAIELEVEPPIGVVARAVVAREPNLVSVGAVLDGRVVAGGAGTNGTTGHDRVAGVVQRDGQGDIGTIARTVIAGHPKLGSVGIILDGRVVVGRRGAAVRRTGD